MYIHSLASICSSEPRTIEYTITEATGDKKYLTSFTYEKNKAIVLVSQYPMFNTQKQLLKIIHEKVISHQGIPESENTFEFWLSLIFYHFKLDSSNLLFQLVSNGASILQYENNLSEKCFKLENFNFRELFLMIKPKFFIEIFICVLHERKIVIVNSDEGENASII
jgi:hypothetical protein